MKDFTTKEKIVRWNISKAMSCVCDSLNKSKLKPKCTQKYKNSMENLKELYNLTQVQVWIICLTCNHYVEREDSSTLRSLANNIDVAAMSIMTWKKEIDNLIEKGFLELYGTRGDFIPVRELKDSLYTNTIFNPQPKHEMDEISFLNTFSERYENRRILGISDYTNQRELARYEIQHQTLPMIQRLIKEIEDCNNRFILYDVANDVLKGGDSSLNETLSDLFDGETRYLVATEMMEEEHILLQKGLIEFCKKGEMSTLF